MGKVAREFDYYEAPKFISEEEMERRWAKAFGSAEGTMNKKPLDELSDKARKAGKDDYDYTGR